MVTMGGSSRNFGHLVQEEAESRVVLLVHGACNDLVGLIVVLVGVALQPGQDVVAADDVLAPGDAICTRMQSIPIKSATMPGSPVHTQSFTCRALARQLVYGSTQLQLTVMQDGVLG